MMAEELFEVREGYVDRILREFKESQQITCPYCGTNQSDEIAREHFSIEGGELDCLCEHCERVFLVIEEVMRTFETSPITEEVSKEV